MNSTKTVDCIPFAQLEYNRPDFEAAQAALDGLTARAKSAESADALRAVIDELNGLMDKQVGLPCDLAMIRCYLSSSDPYYAAEMQACSQGSALLDSTPFAAAVLASPHAAELEKQLGPLYFQRQRDRVRLLSAGHELLAKEAQLVNQYQQLKATLRIPFDGADCSEGEMTAYLTSPDRAVRRAAYIARQNAFLSKKRELDDLLDQLVHTRVALAKANGFDRYVDYINLEKGRHSYGQAELLAFCAQVKQVLVPLAKELTEAQAGRLGISRVCAYDANMVFADGNPKPIGDGPALLEAGKAMYDRLDPEIAALYRAMADNGYIDVTASPNKISNMGFCTGLGALKMPYIFGNCDGSSSDATVLTHEMGHAYQGWLCMHGQPVPEYCDMPNDAVEIPSKAMEQFTSPFAEVFFGPDAAKFRYDQLQYVVREICAFCATHEYEHWLYANPDAAPGQRIERFNQVMAEYDPGIDQSETAAYDEAGAQLYRSMGVYMFPGYVISYALSDMGALEFRARYEADPAAAWADYHRLCSLGGSRDYDGLMQAAHLHNAYEPGAVARAAKALSAALAESAAAL